MRFSKFLQTCSPEELAEFEQAVERAKLRSLAALKDKDILQGYDLEVERDIVAKTLAGLRYQLSISIRKYRIAKHNEHILREGLDEIGKIAIKNAEAADYWRKLALAYEVKLKKDA